MSRWPASLAVAAALCVQAASTSQPETNTAVSIQPDVRRIQRIRDNAMAYAYYLRSAYLRRRVTHDFETSKATGNARINILEAALYLERALEYAPRVPYLWWEYAALNNGLGRVSKVIYAYEQLVALEPGPGLHSKLGVLYELRGEPDLAVNQYERALAYDIEDALLKERIVDVYIEAGFKAEGRGDDELSAAQFRRALEKLNALLSQTDKARLRTKEGLLHELLDDEGAALQAYSAAIKLDPDSPEPFLRASHIHYTLGDRAHRAGRAEEAQEHYGRAAGSALSVVPEKRRKPELLNYTAYVLALSGTNLDLAETLVTKAIEEDRHNGAFVDTLGWIYFRKGETEQALEKVLRARDLEGDDPVIADHLGDIYYSLGQPDKAREMWMQSLRQDARNKTVKNKLERLH